MNDAVPDIVLSEWAGRHISGLTLSAGDRALASDLRQGRRILIQELREGLVIDALGWIGVVRLSVCTIRVEPRLIDGHRNLVALLGYIRGVELLKRLAQDATFDAEGVDLFDLMAWLLAEACENVLRLGVQADYVEQRDHLPALRGRLDLRAQTLERFGQLDRLVCDYEDRLRDIPENRWLVRALRVARRGVANERIAAAVKRTAGAWEELCSDDATEQLARPVITRTNHHYRDALALAYLVTQGVTSSDLLSSGRVSGFSFMLNMARLFEEFVAAAIAQLSEGTGVVVESQASDASILWDAEAHRSFASLRPDLLLTSSSGRERLPIDSKYKDYDSEKIQASDIYQTAIYALAMSSERPATGLRRCVLIHPSHAFSPRTAGARVQVRVDGIGKAEIRSTGVNVPALLQELSDRCIGPESERLSASL